ncbi:type II toxin-antitoxin system RelE/ParE family toxin [Flavobacterium undicola]|uniref:type II toxin-antitoxin system RelE/ParE family toxin n=1 Tax=Flavobacterium undicola TaxID=1932779 RepID=UPI001378FD96|nr:type II toxin-antitoxin system RelE/ParE family toxin [Flavobacterium undicola]MBA0883699.1 type II toxin-antitoxin system RelE/ParE family toxin [Flavobacterium undicola]
MKIKLQEDFLFELNNQIYYISKDKPVAARKFKSDLLRNIKKDLKNPLHFKKSRYYNDENIRDYVFKGYTIVYYIDIEQEIVLVFGFIKHKNSL